MKKDDFLLALRLRLDEAITYETKSKAILLAKEGLNYAQKLNLPAEIFYFKGQLEILSENYSKALEYFKEAIRLNPKDGAAYNDLALCLAELGLLDEALRYFDQGISVEPDFATIYHNKGWLLNNLGRHSEAIRCFETALSIQPDRAVTYDNLADALYNLGDYHAALKAYEKVLKLLKPGQCRGIRKAILAQIKEIRVKLDLNSTDMHKQR